MDSDYAPPPVRHDWELGDPPQEGARACAVLDGSEVRLEWVDQDDECLQEIPWPFTTGRAKLDDLKALGFEVTG